MMTFRFIMVGLALVASGSWAFAETAVPTDGRFSAMASVGNTFEVDSSRLALKNSSDVPIRAFAHRMIVEHTMAQAKLDGAADVSGAESGRMLDDAHEKKLLALSALSGADFDQAYLADQVEAHEKTLQMLDDFAVDGFDPALRSWAANTRPVVAMHLQMVQTISGQ